MSPPTISSSSSGCHGSKAECYTLRWNDWLPAVQETLRNIKREKTFSDLNVVTEDGKSYHAHKVVIATSSLVLNKVLKVSLLGRSDTMVSFVVMAILAIIII